MLRFISKLALFALFSLSCGTTSAMEADNAQLSSPVQKLRTYADECKTVAIGMVKEKEEAQRVYAGSNSRLMRHIRMRESAIEKREADINQVYKAHMKETINGLIGKKDYIAFAQMIKTMMGGECPDQELKTALILLKLNPLGKTYNAMTKKWESLETYKAGLVPLQAVRDRDFEMYQSFYGKHPRAQLRTCYFSLEYEFGCMSFFFEKKDFESECFGESKAALLLILRQIGSNDYTTESQKAGAMEMLQYFTSILPIEKLINPRRVL